MLERSIALAREDDRPADIGRAYINIASALGYPHDWRRTEPYLVAGLAYCSENGLEAWENCLRGMRAEADLAAGRFDAAVQVATDVLALVADHQNARHGPLIVLGLVRARRGDPDAWSPLDEALDVARVDGSMQYHAPVASARAEVAWLHGPERPDRRRDARGTRDGARARQQPGPRARCWSGGAAPGWRTSSRRRCRTARSGSSSPAITAAPPSRGPSSSTPTRPPWRSPAPTTSGAARGARAAARARRVGRRGGPGAPVARSRCAQRAARSDRPDARERRRADEPPAGRARASSPTACATRRSPSGSSSPRRPWTTTSRRSSAGSACATAGRRARPLCAWA